VDASFQCLPTPWPGCGVGEPATIEKESNYFRIVKGDKFISGFRWWNFKKPEMLWPTLKDCFNQLPDYNSLDAMQAAVLMQDERFQRVFAIRLMGVVPTDNTDVLMFHQLTVTDWQAVFVETLKQLKRIK
jgi:hypothetical protein